MKLVSLVQIRLTPWPRLVNRGKYLDGRHQVEFGQCADLDPGDAKLLGVAVKNLHQLRFKCGRWGARHGDSRAYCTLLKAADKDIGTERASRLPRPAQYLDSLINARDVRVREAATEFVTDLCDKAVMKVGPRLLQLQERVHSRKRSCHARPPVQRIPRPIWPGFTRQPVIHSPASTLASRGSP